MSFAIRHGDTFESVATADDAGIDGSAELVPAGYFAWKDYGGRCLAAVLFVAGLPIMAATMLLVRLTSRGPAIYRQLRVGRNGRTFMMYKIRTMRVDAEAATGPVWTQSRDPRITPVGRWIRKLHLDEFPQLVNVLRGEMALIGPRPERPEFTRNLAVEIPGYLNRLAVRPGITGLAQINLPPDTDAESVRRKLVLDLDYVREGRLSLDLKILACTFVRLFGFKGPRVTRLFHLDYTSRLPSPSPVVDSSTDGTLHRPADSVRVNGRHQGKRHWAALDKLDENASGFGIENGSASKTEASPNADSRVHGRPDRPQRRLPR